MFTELSCEAGDGVLRAGGTRLAPTEPAGETGPIGSEVLPAYKKTLRVYPEGFLIQQVMGIEPTYPAWKAGVLPLNYTCVTAKYILQYFAAHVKHKILLTFQSCLAVNLLSVRVKFQLFKSLRKFLQMSGEAVVSPLYRIELCVFIKLLSLYGV